MRLAVLSDIHGNLVALETVISDLEALGGAETIWILGDLAAFGPRPAECIRRVRDWREAHGKEKFEVIGGNTDRYMVNGQRPRTPSAQDAESFARLSQSWQGRDSMLNWSVGQITYEEYEVLRKIRGRDTGLDVEDYGYVIGYHGTPDDDEGFLTPETPAEEALDMLLEREGRLAIGAHIHKQMDRDLGRWRVINVGSIGMSFDAPGMAQWGLFTFENGAVEVDLRCVPYDREAVMADVRSIGHPAREWFIRVLREGD